MERGFYNKSSLLHANPERLSHDANLPGAGIFVLARR